MKSKTIAIIGGMGPQASVFAHSQLVNELVKYDKNANIVHVSLVVEPFFDAKPTLNLTDTQKELLSSVQADIGFIACNTAHYFFDQIQEIVSFPLEHIVRNTQIVSSSLVACSPTSSKMQLFGEHCTYPSSDTSKKLGTLIEDVNLGRRPESLRETLQVVESQDIVFGCTEISMRAHAEGLKGVDTLQVTIEKIVREL